MILFPMYCAKITVAWLNVYFLQLTCAWKDMFFIPEFWCSPYMLVSLETWVEIQLQFVGTEEKQISIM